MRPVRVGDRGAAVEDIQRRLRTLGFDLGITGIDGVFFGRTADAVRSFQQQHGLAEDGLHPNPAGFAIMAPLAERAIGKALQSG